MYAFLMRLDRRIRVLALICLCSDPCRRADGDRPDRQRREDIPLDARSEAAAERAVRV